MMKQGLWGRVNYLQFYSKKTLLFPSNSYSWNSTAASLPCHLLYCSTDLGFSVALLWPTCIKEIIVLKWHSVKYCWWTISFIFITFISNLSSVMEPKVAQMCHPGAVLPMGVKLQSRIKFWWAHGRKRKGRGGPPKYVLLLCDWSYYLACLFLSYNNVTI